MTTRVLVIDDDQELTSMLQEFLASEGFEVECAADAAQGLAAISERPADLLVLDVMLPGASGFDLLRSLRQSHARLPVLMLTARGEAVDRILGLELGADDYLAKPFDPRELAARLRAIHRRAQSATHETTQAVLELGKLKIDERRRRATWADAALDLTAAELRIITLLAKAAAQPIERAELTEQALGRKLTLYDRSIDTHISNLRRKLAQAGASGIEIRSVRGTGYELLLVEPS
jgi:two-component system, OmpR family, response regulator CpxR